VISVLLVIVVFAVVAACENVAVTLCDNLDYLVLVIIPLVMAQRLLFGVVLVDAVNEFVTNLRSQIFVEVRPIAVDASAIATVEIFCVILHDFVFKFVIDRAKIVQFVAPAKK
jgi:hypothetical protein